MSKRKKKRYDDEFEYEYEYEYENRSFPAAYTYDPRFFPGGLPGLPGYNPYQGGTPTPGGQPLPPAKPPVLKPPFAGGPGGFPGGPGGGPGNAPTTRPPNYIPQKPVQATAGGPQTYAVSAGSLRPCLNRFVYVWLQNGNAFWFYPIYIDRRTVAGYRWNGFSWSYIGLDLRRIDYFQCS